MKNMKKIIQMLLIIMLALSTTGCFMTKEKAVKILLEHLEETYGEPFYISSPFGGRGTGDEILRVSVQPLRYKGTEKQWDSYYEEIAGVTKYGRPGDSYGRILLNESANNFFQPKLEELFGKNIIVALDVTGLNTYTDFEKELAKRRRKSKEKGYHMPPIEGDIHIFGRIDSIEDREKYRKKIYEFIQYIKEKGYFEYLYITVKIYDERVLAPSYYWTDKELEKIFENSKNSNEFKEKRKKKLSKLDKEFENLDEKEIEKILNSLNRTELDKFKTGNYRYGYIYHSIIVTPKFLEKEKRFKLYKTNYENINELRLIDSMKFKYNEYIVDKNINWGE